MTFSFPTWVRALYFRLLNRARRERVDTSSWAGRPDWYRCEGEFAQHRNEWPQLAGTGAADAASCLEITRRLLGDGEAHRDPAATMLALELALELALICADSLHQNAADWANGHGYDDLVQMNDGLNRIQSRLAETTEQLSYQVARGGFGIRALRMTASRMSDIAAGYQHATICGKETAATLKATQELLHGGPFPG